MRFRPTLGLILAALLFQTTLASAAPAPQSDFSDWHLPVPAGNWRISRGPCNSPWPYDHQCGYYEDACALDLIPAEGSMANVPVLAPQAGQGFFICTRQDARPGPVLRPPGGPPS